jgi:hypothetical protein
MKLTSSNVLPWIRDDIVLGLETKLGKIPIWRHVHHLLLSERPNVSLKLLLTSTLQKPKPGNSALIAEWDHKSIAVLLMPDTIAYVDLPVFNLNAVKKAAPDLDWNDESPTFNLDSRKL